MKATKPSSVLLEEKLRDDIEESKFIGRGLASIARAEASGRWISAEDVIAKLEAKVAAARERRDKQSS